MIRRSRAGRWRRRPLLAAGLAGCLVAGLLGGVATSPATAAGEDPPAATTTTLAADPTDPHVGDAATLTATVASAEGVPTGKVDFTRTTGPGAPHKVATVDLVPGSQSAAATTSVTANSTTPVSYTATYKPGGAPWATSTSTTVTVTARKKPQTVTISAAPADPVLIGDTWTPTVGSDAPSRTPTVSASPTSVCTVSSGTVSFVDDGLCTVTASDPGNATYAPGEASRQVRVRRPVLLTLSTTPTTPRFGADVAVTVVATDQLDPAHPVVPGTGSLTVQDVTGTLTTDTAAGRATRTFSPTGARTHTVSAGFNPTDTTTYAAATKAGSVTVAKATQTITLTGSAPSPGRVSDTWTPTLSGGGSGNPVQLAAVAPLGSCTVSGGVVTFTAAGTCHLSATQAGTATTYEAATRAIDVEVRRISVTLGLQVSPGSPTAGAGVEVRAVARARGSLVAGSGTLGVDGVGATPDGAWFGSGRFYAFTPTRATSHTARGVFTPTDSTTYAPAVETLDFSVGQGQQTITLGREAPPSARVGRLWDPQATGGGSSSPVVVSVTGSDAGACEVQGGSVTFTAAGTCRVTLSQAGDADYHAATSLQRTVTVTRNPVTVYLTWAGSPSVGHDLPVSVQAEDADGVAVPGTGTVTVAGGGDRASAAVDLPQGSADATLVPELSGLVDLTFTFTPSDAVTFTPTSLTREIDVERGTTSIGFTGPRPTAARVADTWTPGAHPLPPGHGGTVVVAVDAAASVADGQPTCAFDGTVVTFLRAGTCRVTADLPATPDWEAAPRVVTTVTVARNPTSTTLSVSGPVEVDRPVAVTVDIERTASGGPAAPEVAGAVQLLVDGAEVGDPVTVVGNHASVPLTLPAERVYRVETAFIPDDTRTFAGSIDEAGVQATRRSQSVTVDPAAPSPARVGATWQPSTSSTSGLPVALGRTAASAEVCSVTGDSVHFLASGSCRLTHDQAGNRVWQPAPRVEQTITVATNPTTVAVSVAPGARVGDPSAVTADVSAVGGAVGTVRFAVEGQDAGGPVPVVGGTARGTVVPRHAGSHTVRATFSPTDQVTHAGSQATTPVEVAKAPVDVTITVTRTVIEVKVATTTPDGGHPTGPVEVAAGDDDLGAGALVDGTATIVHTLDPDQEYKLTAYYPGDADRLAGAGTATRSLPTIVPSVSPAAPHAAGWYRTPVTVSFTCTATSAPLDEPCPDQVLEEDGTGQRASHTVTAEDGGRARAAVGPYSIDRTEPKVSVVGPKDGAWYAGSPPAAACTADDALSGTDGCSVEGPTSVAGSRLLFRTTASATDAAGNEASDTVTYQLRQEWVDRARLQDSGAFRVPRKRKTVTFVARTRGLDAPTLQLQRGRSGGWTGWGAMIPISVEGDYFTWTGSVRLPRWARKAGTYRARVVREDGPKRRLTVQVGGKRAGRPLPPSL